MGSTHRAGAHKQAARGPGNAPSIVYPADRWDQPTPNNLRLWQAPSSKLWTGETDMQAGNLNLTLYILKLALRDAAI